MAITIDNTSSKESSVNGTSYSWNHTVTADLTDDILVVITNIMASQTGDQPFNISATYNDVSMVKALETEHATTNRNHNGAIFYLINPSTGSNAIALTTTANVDACIATGISLYDVDQSTPMPTTAFDTTKGTTLSVDITTANANSWVLGIVSEWGDDNRNYAPLSGVTEIHDMHSNSGTPASTETQGATGRMTAASIDTYTFGFSSAGNNAGGQTNAVELKEAGAAPPATFIPKLVSF